MRIGRRGGQLGEAKMPKAGVNGARGRLMRPIARRWIPSHPGCVQATNLCKGSGGVSKIAKGKRDVTSSMSSQHTRPKSREKRVRLHSFARGLVSPSLSGTSSGPTWHFTVTLNQTQRGCRYVVVTRHWLPFKIGPALVFQRTVIDKHQKCITREQEKKCTPDPQPRFSLSHHRETRQDTCLSGLAPKPPCLTAWPGRICSFGCKVGSPAWPPVLTGNV